MKHYYLLIFATVMNFIAACQKPVEEGQETVPFQPSEQALNFGYNEGEKVLTITSNTQWSIRSTDESWLSVSPTSGTGNASVKVIATKNPSKEEGRSAKLVCTYNNLSVSINVTQGINEEDPIFSITPSTVSLEAGGGTFSIEVISDAVPYEVTIVDDWMSLVSRKGDRYSGETLVFNAQPNISEESRTGVLSVCTENGTCIPVTVSQGAGVTLYSRNQVGYRFTATWCGYCPYMDEAFHSVAEQRSDFRFVTFHASNGYPLYFAAVSPLITAYGITGFPTGVLNGWKEIDNYTAVSTTVSKIVSAMDEFDQGFPCLTDIHLTAGIENGSVVVDAEVTSSLDADLKVVSILLESGVVETQTYYPPSGNTQSITDFEHDNIARALLTESVTGDSITVEADKPVSLHWSTPLASAWNMDNLSVYVGVFRAYEDYTGPKDKKKYPDSYIDNCRIVPVQ